MARSFVGEWQDENPLPMESAYHPNTDAEFEVLDGGFSASIIVGRVIE
jgi:hypothetical protein